MDESSIKNTNMHARLATILGECAATKGFSRRSFAELTRLVASTYLGDDETELLLNLSSELCGRIDRGQVNARAGVQLVRLFAVLAGMPSVADELDADIIAAHIAQQGVQK